MKSLQIASLIAAALLGAGGARAAPIYRCGNTYSQAPCSGGKIVDATDSRTAAQRAEGRRIAAKEKQRAARAALAASQPASSPSTN